MFSLNTVPEPAVPPRVAVPKMVFPDVARVAHGYAPSEFAKEFGSALLKACRATNPVPSTFILKTIPLLAAPPLEVVPNRVLLNRTNPPSG